MCGEVFRDDQGKFMAAFANCKWVIVCLCGNDRGTGDCIYNSKCSRARKTGTF